MHRVRKVLSKVAGRRQVYQESGIAAMVAQILLDRPFASAAALGDTAVAWGAVAQTLARDVECVATA